MIKVRKSFKTFSNDPKDINETANKILKWEKKVLKRMRAIEKNNWLNKSIAGDFKTMESAPNPLKGKTYLEVYGEEKALEWQNNRKKGSKRYWKSENGLKRKSFLSQNKHPNFTTYGKSSPNKITETFIHVCEICGKEQIFRKLKNSEKRKTCGSKSCAMKWCYKHKRKNMHTYGGCNKIEETFVWKCKYCGKEVEKRKTSNNMKRLTCGKSCAASYNNIKRAERGYSLKGIKHKSKK